MSPRALTYKSNSVIYFQGDTSEKIFILKSGRVLMKSHDIETNEEIKELIQTGEFFGVKSALGKYPRDETALVLQDADILTFTVQEFENLVLSNTRIIMKMLKVFSNQLRRIHNKVQNLISKNEEQTPDNGLFSIGTYYLRNRMYPQAVYAFNRYLTYYPDGPLANEATQNLQTAESYATHPPKGASPAVAGAAPTTAAGAGRPAPSATGGAGSGDAARSYYQAVALMGQENHAEALKLLQKMIQAGEDPDHLVQAEYEMGRCLVFLSKFDEAIRQFTGLIQKYPKHPNLAEALYYIGQAYEGKNDASWARNFYNKVLSMVEEDDPVGVKTRKALKALGGAS